MAPRVERRLAASLAADVVGYSRLVGDDEAGTIARLKALRQTLIEPLIADHPVGLRRRRRVLRARRLALQHADRGVI
jgi:class 3 adenylate cyclase